MLSMQCIFSTFAELDLEEIADYIARDNPNRALSYIGKIHGRPFGRYLIFYMHIPGTVRIGRILSNSRLLSNDCFLFTFTRSQTKSNFNSLKLLGAMYCHFIAGISTAPFQTTFPFLPRSA